MEEALAHARAQALGKRGAAGESRGVVVEVLRFGDAPVRVLAARGKRPVALVPERVMREHGLTPLSPARISNFERSKHAIAWAWPAPDDRTTDACRTAVAACAAAGT